MYRKKVPIGNLVCLCSCRKNVRRKFGHRKCCYRKKVAAPLQRHFSNVPLFVAEKQENFCKFSSTSLRDHLDVVQIFSDKRGISVICLLTYIYRSSLTFVSQRFSKGCSNCFFIFSFNQIVDNQSGHRFVDAQ